MMIRPRGRSLSPDRISEFFGTLSGYLELIGLYGKGQWGNIAGRGSYIYCEILVQSRKRFTLSHFAHQSLIPASPLVHAVRF